MCVWNVGFIVHYWYLDVTNVKIYLFVKINCFGRSSAEQYEYVYIMC